MDIKELSNIIREIAGWKQAYFFKEKKFAKHSFSFRVFLFSLYIEYTGLQILLKTWDNLDNLEFENLNYAT